MTNEQLTAKVAELQAEIERLHIGIKDTYDLGCVYFKQLSDSRLREKQSQDTVNKLMVAAEEWSLYVEADYAPVTLVNYLREAIK